MRARGPALFAAIVLIASACQASTSPSPSSAASQASQAAVSPSPAASPRPSVLRVARISDFLPSIHPVELGTGNQELMADLVFNRLVDVDKDDLILKRASASRQIKRAVGSASCQDAGHGRHASAPSAPDIAAAMACVCRPAENRRRPAAQHGWTRSELSQRPIRRHPSRGRRRAWTPLARARRSPS